jgi:uncharacterized protein YbjT (DUF2867 family)
MRVVIFGATGMVGKGVLLECLDAARIDRVLLVSRHPIDVSHPKLREIVHQDFFDFVSIQSQFVDVDACFFCLGVSAAGVSEREYHHLTYDLTLAPATALASVAAPRLTFCYVSGEGTDSTERGRAGLARTKGKTENALLRLPFHPLFRRLLPRYVTTTVNIGRAMIHVAATGYSGQILLSADINQLSA